MRLLWSILLSLCMTLATAAGLPSEPVVYRQVLRDAQGRPVPQKAIQVRVAIRGGSGAVVLTETHQVTTSYRGVYTLTIGAGTAQQGSLAVIDPARDYYITVVPDAGAAPAPELLHIPYTFYVQNCHLAAGAARPGYQHYIGEAWGGGVIADTWRDTQGHEHGLIVAPADASDSIAWSSADTRAIGAAARAMYDGAACSRAITSAGMPGAASRCAAYSAGGYHDWYLPAIGELDIIYSNLAWIKKALGASGAIRDFLYWSATEYSARDAWAFGLYGQPSNDYVYSKYSTLHIRPVRRY